MQSSSQEQFKSNLRSQSDRQPGKHRFCVGFRGFQAPYPHFSADSTSQKSPVRRDERASPPGMDYESNRSPWRHRLTFRDGQLDGGGVVKCDCDRETVAAWAETPGSMSLAQGHDESIDRFVDLSVRLTDTHRQADQAVLLRPQGLMGQWRALQAAANCQALLRQS